MIIDASVAFKWFGREADSDQALALIGTVPLIAPALLMLELGNALWKQARRDELDPDAPLDAELASVEVIVSLRADYDLVARALQIARRLDHPIYDCIYIALAEAENDQLVTADRRLLAAVKDSEWRDLVRAL